MAVPDINHKVCMLCDHYDEEACPYCGIGFEGFEIKKHNKKIRAEVIEDCKKIAMADCTSSCEYPFQPDCIECMCNKFDKLKEQDK